MTILLFLFDKRNNEPFSADKNIVQSIKYIDIL